MTGRVPVTLSFYAQKGLDRIVCWYEAESPVVAKHFLEAFSNLRQLLAQHPFLYRIQEGHIRKCSLKKFPYYLYYSATQKEVFILAIYHQDPTVVDALLKSR